SLGGITLDLEGRVIFSDALSNLVYRINHDGTLCILISRDTPSAIKSEKPGNGHPRRVCVTRDGRLLLCASNGPLHTSDAMHYRHVSVLGTDGLLRRFAGTVTLKEGSNLAVDCHIRVPTAMCEYADGRVLIVGNSDSQIYQVDTNGVITTVAGTDLQRG